MRSRLEIEIGLKPCVRGNKTGKCRFRVLFTTRGGSRCIQIKGYALPKKVGLMSFAAKRKQIEKNVKNREYSQGSKQVA